MSIFGKSDDRSKHAAEPAVAPNARVEPPLTMRQRASRGDSLGGPLSRIDQAAEAGHIAYPEIKPPAATPHAPPKDAEADNDHKQMRLGDRLVEMGLISRDQLEVALHERRQSDRFLGEVFVDLGFITQSALSAVLAESAGLEQFDPATAVFDADLVDQVPKEIATKYGVLPVSMDGDVLQVAMADPHNVLALDQLRRCFPRDIEIQPLLSSTSDLAEALDRLYGYEMSVDGILREIETGEIDMRRLATEDGYINPTVRLVSAIIMDAVKVGASDIHFEPEGVFVRLRYRIDGALTQMRTFHKDYWPAVSVRIKIIAGMNIADTRNPQDGRMSIMAAGREVDFRVASHPTVHGENIVVRVLDKHKSLKPLEELGFSTHNTEVLETLLKRPEGIAVITGPTGSGKTTTLYAMLQKINSVELNVMTLEDPVEYELPLIRQSQIREATGMTFGEGVRSILRQDPDIVFIGEVRDEDTAAMALRAAMAGHQVYTTLHTNDALGTIPRLLDLGLHPSLLSGHVICVLAQRLVRRLCDRCKCPGPATAAQVRILGADADRPPVVWRAVGCSNCGNKGYRGRIAVAEVLGFNAEMDELVAKAASRAELFGCALRHGFKTMADDGIAKVLEGFTSVDELVRHVDMTDRLL